MDIFALLAENKIREAMEKGEFNNLPGSGQPLKLDDLSHVPDDLRAGYRLLKNAGVLPEELEIKKEIITLQKLIDYCYDQDEKRQLTKKLNEKILRFNILMENRKTGSAALSYYKQKIYSKLGGY
ncbi:DnaJ family domain-containing protein [Desulforamulus hydrothermalis]|uniref:DnaJ homologue subfamily C member 28 conserved domain-containing protein n=1 Tax=Desulforamulus hydrothermalis Lam5 = DSM 18033 TaxID=1121428 RepID=K8EIM0_9FIRM|nr:DnaJ family domain-containing protein [Desulforamulus hydrothermalis]CCO08451.1 conserved hypothetical protein [Desulforamulus hydrothermalis Lam5 = DSM 18033]SHH28740.1 protein of unknown function [Desulforamulus hydrothermalis Lam5 = DSM 18033]